MSDQMTTASRLAEVGRLTAALTDQLLDAQVMARPIPADQAQALARGARLLHDNELPWPPMLSQVLHGLAAEVATHEADRQGLANREASSSIVEGLTRFMTAFRREKGET